MAKQREKANQESQRTEGWEGLPPLNRNAAGIDVGSAAHYVAVPVGRDPEPVQEFGSFTADLHRLGRWLKACRIETVVMQATGVYWTALYDVLESYGLQVNLVNARPTKSLPGRKTEVHECQWLQKLHTFGLLNNSFRPAEEIRAAELPAPARESGHGGGERDPAHAKGADGNEHSVGQWDQRYQRDHGPEDLEGHREG